jgi:hypothetical protein
MQGPGFIFPSNSNNGTQTLAQYTISGSGDSSQNTPKVYTATGSDLSASTFVPVNHGQQGAHCS